MRKMMEGVVLFGTGKQAQLDGYSSGGKTGTAQKIDPVTHTYSKTMHIASFAGFAPVNNPVISVAVVIDSPKGRILRRRGLRARLCRGGAAGPRISRRAARHRSAPRRYGLKKDAPVTEDDSSTQGEDIQALYDAANDLPSDDPLRAAPARIGRHDSARRPASRHSRCRFQSRRFAMQPVRHTGTTVRATTQIERRRLAANTVVIADAGQLRVPSLIGLPVRKVIEQAGAAGLEVEIAGNGTAREQAPAPGTMVPPAPKSSSAAHADCVYMLEASVTRSFVADP